MKRDLILIFKLYLLPLIFLPSFLPTIILVIYVIASDIDFCK